MLVADDKIPANATPFGVLTNSLTRGGELLLAETVEMLGYQDTAEETRLNYKNARKLLNDCRNDAEIEKKIAVSPYSPWYFPPEMFKTWLQAFPPKQGVSVHIPQTRALAPLMDELNYRHVLIMRDPRAVLAGLVFDPPMPLFFLNADFESLSLAQRLRFLAEGGYAEKAATQVVPFAEVYRSMLDWKNFPDCLTVSYEELVGDLGLVKQKQSLQSIASYLNTGFNDAVFEKINRTNASWAHRLKISELEQWTSIVDAESLNYIMDYCQPLCCEAGYE